MQPGSPPRFRPADHTVPVDDEGLDEAEFPGDFGWLAEDLRVASRTIRGLSVDAQTRTELMRRLRVAADASRHGLPGARRRVDRVLADIRLHGGSGV